jgi:hypothetical protein
MMGATVVLFARDASQIEFDYAGERWVALLLPGNKAQVYNKAKPDGFDVMAKQWFIENQTQFNLEGYQ